MTGTHDEIAEVEALIEHVAEVIERCRKISFGARALTAAGGLAILLAVFATVTVNPTLLFGGIAAAIGGFVLTGSNRTTREQHENLLHELEDKRRAMIDGLALRRVEERPTLH
ncbi:MAG: hypothetical protein AB7O50_10190 [Pseudolabrys sp.]